jgi:hypothetical protein
MEDRLREAAVVKVSSKRKRWTDMKARLETFDRTGLLGLIADLLPLEVRHAIADLGKRDVVKQPSLPHTPLCGSEDNVRRRLLLVSETRARNQSCELCVVSK